MPNALRILCVDPACAFARQIAESLAGHDDFQWQEPLERIHGPLAFDGEPPDVIVYEADLPEGPELIAGVQAYNRSNPDKADVGVLLIAKRSRKNAEETIQALEAGAFDFVIRQELPDERAVTNSLARQLTVKLRHFSSKRIFAGIISSSARQKQHEGPKQEQSLPTSLRALLIGVSTGGPKVLSTLLPRLTRASDLPVLIVQHMPLGFTASLARSLDAKCTHKVAEAEHGEIIRPRNVYIAPGGKHMLVRNGASREPCLALSDDPPEEGCRPSVNMLFRSAAAVYGSSAAAIILTGMGSDGSKGLRDLKAAGAFAMAQNEATSVVWGMPGSAVAAGLIDKVLPPEEMPASFETLLKAERN
jgi:two-component system chemotaxis response regulator CheB